MYLRSLINRLLLSWLEKIQTSRESGYGAIEDGRFPREGVPLSSTNIRILLFFLGWNSRSSMHTVRLVYIEYNYCCTTMLCNAIYTALLAWSPEYGWWPEAFQARLVQTQASFLPPSSLVLCPSLLRSLYVYYTLWIESKPIYYAIKYLSNGIK